MDETQAQTFEEQLRGLVVEAQLQWVLDQVDDVIREGKPEFRKVGREALREPAGLVPTELTQKRGVLASEPYSARERLRLLIQAIHRVIVEPVALREETSRLLIRSDRATEVRWIDELEREPAREITDLAAEERAATQRRGRLIELLDELERRV